MTVGIYRYDEAANDGGQDVILNEVKNLLEADKRRSQKGWSRRRSFVTLRMTERKKRMTFGRPCSAKVEVNKIATSLRSSQ